MAKFCSWQGGERCSVLSELYRGLVFTLTSSSGLAAHGKFGAESVVVKPAFVATVQVAYLRLT